MQTSASNAFFATLGAALIVASLFFVSKHDIGKPNILIITLDSLRTDHMGIYGYDKPTTPFLDSLFKRGVVFENAYIPAFLTFQTDASILSGLYPSEHNMRTWTTPIQDSVPLLSDAVKLYGYTTHEFASPPLKKYFGLHTRFDTYKVYMRKDNFDLSKADVYTELASSTEPKLITWQIYDIHVPYSKASKEFFPASYQGQFLRQNDEVWRRSYEEYRDEADALSEEDYAYVLASYDTGIRRVDDGLKDFFSELEKSGLLKNTIIVITAEHGDDLLEHGFIFHRDLYGVNTHVPLAIIYPEVLLPQRVTQPVSVIDLAPTLTSLARIPVMESGHGADLTPLMQGKKIPERDIYMERAPFGDYAVIAWPWKYILRNPSRDIPGLGTEQVNEFFTTMRKNDVTHGDELYNLVDDPYEQVNRLGEDRMLDARLMQKVLVYKRQMEQAVRKNTGVRDINNDDVHFTYP
jgi:choline-sulfatase